MLICTRFACRIHGCKVKTKQNVRDRGFFHRENGALDGTKTLARHQSLLFHWDTLVSLQRSPYVFRM